MTERNHEQGWLRLWPQFLFAAFLGYWPRLLFLLPLVAVLWVPSYNRIEPELAGIPFFYWYQLALILAGAALVMIVYVIETRFLKIPEKDDLETERTPGDIL